MDLSYDFRDAGAFVWFVLVTPVFLVVLVMSALVFGPLLLTYWVLDRFRVVTRSTSRG